MCIRKLTYNVLYLVLLSAFVMIAGCAKEYSFEGRAIPDSTISIDTVPTPGPGNPNNVALPNCVGCTIPDTASTTRWRFKIGSSFLCGSITNAVLSPDRNAMTFFGPSVCSLDSGLVITAYFNNQALNTDQVNITCDRAALEYYDNTTGFNLLESSPTNFFSLTISSYIKQTGVATGTFSGHVLDKSGRPIKIDAGKFKVIFK